MGPSKTELDIATTERKPDQNEMLLGTREFIMFVFAKFAYSRKKQLRNSKIQNKVLRNIVRFPAGKRATHVSHNESLAKNLLRPSASRHTGRWMFWKHWVEKGRAISPLTPAQKPKTQIKIAKITGPSWQYSSTLGTCACVGFGGAPHVWHVWHVFRNI